MTIQHFLCSEDAIRCYQCEEYVVTNWAGEEMPDVEIPAELKAAFDLKPCKGSSKPCLGVQFDGCFENFARINLTTGPRVEITQKGCAIQDTLKTRRKSYVDSWDMMCEYGVIAEIEHILSIFDYDDIFCNVGRGVCLEDSCNMVPRGAKISLLIFVTDALIMLLFLHF